MNDDKLCISPDALIAMIVTEAQDRALAQPWQWRFSPAQCCPSRPCGTRLSKH